MGIFEKITSEMDAMKKSDSLYEETTIPFMRKRAFVVECEREDCDEGEVIRFEISFVKNDEDIDGITIYPGENDKELEDFVRNWSGEKKDGTPCNPVTLKDGRVVYLEDIEEALKLVNEALGPDICHFIRKWDDEMYEDWEYIQQLESETHSELRFLKGETEGLALELNQQVDALDDMFCSGRIGRLHMKKTIEDMRKNVEGMLLLLCDD